MEIIRRLFKRDPSLGWVVVTLLAIPILICSYLWPWKFPFFLLSTTIVLFLFSEFLLEYSPRSSRGITRLLRLFGRGILLRTYLKLCLLNQSDWAMYSYLYVIPQAQKGFHCTKVVSRPESDHVRVVAISDTHETHHFVVVPDGDILVITGDLLFFDECRFGKGISKLREINTWLGTLPHKHKIIVAGNHDDTIAKIGPEETKKIFTNAIYLENEFATICGLKIFGSPISIPNRNGGNNRSFQYSEEEALGILDPILQSSKGQINLFLAHGLTEELQDNIAEKYHPEFIIGGHFHEGYGCSFANKTTYINAATVGAFYLPTHPPIMIDITS